jgi:ribosomal protein S18 acetylase RimI-like enzyme
VKSLEVLPFSDEHLEGAARLLAARHARDRKAEPMLPERFEEPGAALQELQAAWTKEGVSGAAAMREGQLVGYLVGAPREPETWGENVWVELAGHAVADAEVVRDLYARAAARWVEEGRARHYSLVPASDSALVDAWFRLGFGQQHAHGDQEVSASIEVRPPAGVEIRRPSDGDVEALLQVDVALPRHQQDSPVFSNVPLPTEEELRKDWADTLAGGDEFALVAYLDGSPVAVWVVAPPGLSRQHRGLGVPDNAALLGFASTLPELRGSGIGSALTDASLAWAAEQGYSAMITDWRVTNLLASRFWPRRGFRTFALRVYRSIP